MINLVKDRQCGDCAACCDIPAINSDHFVKPADTRCPHHQAGVGCTIYAQRPSACKQWYCAWRLIESLPNEYRPDKLGVMLSFEHNPLIKNKHIIVARAFGKTCEEAYSSDNFLNAAAILHKQHLPVWVSFGHHMKPFESETTMSLNLHNKPPQNRNDLCACGSGLRYKHCHGKM